MNPALNGIRQNDPHANIGTELLEHNAQILVDHHIVVRSVRPIRLRGTQALRADHRQPDHRRYCEPDCHDRLLTRYQPLPTREK